MKPIILALAFSLISQCLLAQHNNSVLPTSINDLGEPPHESAILDLSQTKKGLLVPVMDVDGRDVIANPADGLVIYNTTSAQLEYFDGSNWKEIGGSIQSSIYDADFTTGIHTEQSANEDVIRFQVNTKEYMSLDEDRLVLEHGNSNVYLGINAGSSLGTGSNNTAIGEQAQSNILDGAQNIAIGNFALSDNDDGNNNVAIGFGAGQFLSGKNNVLLGNEAGNFGSDLDGSVFIGNRAGYYETEDHRLHIANSEFQDPLIYGQFDSAMLRVNGQFQIGIPYAGGYSFPEMAGSEGQTLTSNADGNLSWASSSSIWSEDTNGYQNQDHLAVGDSSRIEDQFYIQTDDAFSALRVTNKRANLGTTQGIFVQNDATNNSTKYGLRVRTSVDGTGKHYGIHTEAFGQEAYSIYADFDTAVSTGYAAYINGPSKFTDAVTLEAGANPATNGQIRLSRNGSFDGASVGLHNGNGEETVSFLANKGFDRSAVQLKQGDGRRAVELSTGSLFSEAGRIEVFDSSGSLSMVLAGDVAGKSRITTDELEITGGSDLAEFFDISSSLAQPGMIVSLDPYHDGQLRISDSPYDSKVVGIISGANGIDPGMLMGQSGSIADGEYPIALTGRVYVKVTDENGPIAVGDMICSSSTYGHGMRATDAQKSFGTIVGKAMQAHDKGTAEILILVNLQ